jgi:ribosomal peptide maturation radical SAM protein 1
VRVVLVNMPFASLRFPSFALSQLAAVVQDEVGAEVDIDVLYANHELAAIVGVDLHDELTESVEHHPTGLGEWLFRQVAFPELPSNEDRYLRTFYPTRRHASLRKRVLEVREVLGEFCSRLASDHDLGSAHIVGFTSMFAQTVPSIAMARTVKRLAPEVITIMGGANCEAPMGAALLRTTTALDFVFSGQALRSFPLFVRYVLDGRVRDCDSVAGIVSARNAWSPRAKHTTGETRPIDEVIEPDFSAFIQAFDKTYVDSDVKPILFFETSRGCWWGQRSHCTFCGLNGLAMAYRAMEPSAAVEQFERLFRYHPWCSEYFAVDNIMPVNYPTDVFARLRPPKGVKIFYELKVNADRSDLAAMAGAGVTSVQPGIEALATGTLKLMRKGTTSFQNIRFLKECAALGITPHWNLLIGFPGEAESVYEKYARDIPLLMHLPPPVGVSFVRFDRYSPYVMDPDAFGLDLQPFDFYGLTFPAADDDLADLAYYFADTRSAAYERAALRWWPRLQELVDDWRDRWSDSSGEPLLRLQGTDHRPEIVDTRAGTTQTYVLEEEASSLLERLRTPMRVASLEGVETLAYLRERGLVFEDGERAVSLVDIPAHELAPSATIAETRPHLTSKEALHDHHRQGGVRVQ